MPRWLVGPLPGLGQALCQSLGAQNFRLGGEIAHHHVHGVVKIGGHGELVGVGIFDSLQGLVDGLPALAGADGETVNGENVLRFDLSTVSIRLAVSWSEVWRLFLGAMVRAMVSPGRSGNPTGESQRPGPPTCRTAV